MSRRAKRIKGIVGLVILIVMVIIIANELREQTTENGWARGSWDYDASKDK